MIKSVSRDPEASLAPVASKHKADTADL